MRKIIKIICFCFIFQTTLYAQWYPQVSGTNYPLKSVCFINENTGFTCTFFQVLKTTNGGNNWQISPLGGAHNCVYFLNSTTGFICSDSGKIYKTTDTGNSWNITASGTSNKLTSISFIDSQTGIISGYGKTVLKTTDGGTSWFSIAENIITQNDFLSAKMLNTDNYFVSGSGTYILKTINGGNSWAEHTHFEPNPIFALEFTDNNTGFATGCCGMFMKTTDNGTHWETMYYLTLGFTLYTIKYINSTTGYTCGDNGVLYRTTNSGASWDSTFTGGTNQSLFSLFMVDENTGWVTGGFGTILKTTNGGGPGVTIGVQQISSEVPNEFYLGQNYPNPFNPSTKIEFQIPSTASNNKVVLTVYDLSGREITTLLNRVLTAGTFEVDWNASSSPSGVYFYRLTSGHYSLARKMILVK